jgi:hypothetical protein
MNNRLNITKNAGNIVKQIYKLFVNNPAFALTQAQALTMAVANVKGMLGPNGPIFGSISDFEWDEISKSVSE